MCMGMPQQVLDACVACRVASRSVVHGITAASASVSGCCEQVSN